MYILKLLSWKDKEMAVNSGLALDIAGLVLQEKKSACFLMTLVQKLLLGNQQQHYAMPILCHERPQDFTQHP